MNTFGASSFGQNKSAGFGQPAAQAGGFGQPAQSTNFRQPQQQMGSFGQQQQPQQQQTGGFGQQARTSGFGQPTAGGFGQPQPPQQVGGFGQPAQSGGFGQQVQAGGFGQNKSVGFGQASQGGFGQPSTSGFGQPTQQQPGGFGQPAQQTGGFGQPAQAGGFGQAAQGGFGQPQQQAGGFGQQSTSGFGQPAQQTGGFGQAKPGGFGQPAQGGFGQPTQQAGGFGQPQQQQAAGGFGQVKTGGFGQQGGGFGQAQLPAAGGFGQPQQQGRGFGQAPQPAATGFGQPQQQQAGGGFGQQAAGGFGAGRGAATGFGQPAAGSFGQAQQPAAGGFGQAAAGGFGQPAAGGFGAGRGATSGFGQPVAGASGFGATPSAAGGFGQPAAGGFGAAQPQAATATGFGQRPSTGGFGQPLQGGGFGAQQPAAGGFGQPPQQTGGFGAQQPAAGGFGAGRGATSGFGQPAAAAGFGQPQQPAAGGFGQPAAAGSFGQPAAGGGFGQPQQLAAGGFGAGRGATTGFGGAAGGFGQPAAATPAGGGFGAAQPATGGFGAPAAAAPAGGFGTAATGGFGQPTAAPIPGMGVNVGRPTDLSFMALPDFNASPYGNVLLFDGYERPAPVKPSTRMDADDLREIIPASRRAMHTWLVGRMRVPEDSTLMKQVPASLASSALSPIALKEMLVPNIQLGGRGAKVVAARTGGQSPIPGYFPSSQPQEVIRAPLNRIAAVSPQVEMAARPPSSRPDRMQAAPPAEGAKKSIPLPLDDVELTPQERVSIAKPSAAVVTSQDRASATGNAAQSRRATTRSSAAGYQHDLEETDRESVASVQPGSPTGRDQKGSALPLDDSDITPPERASRVRSSTAAVASAAAPSQRSNREQPPRCSKSEYVVEPSVEELASYSPAELRQVSNVSVRLSDGSSEVHFLDPVDLRGVDIGAAVRMDESGHVSLSRGSGAAAPALNATAEVWVRDETRERESGLRSFCQAQGDEFVGHHRGSCVYRIKRSVASQRGESPLPEQKSANPLSIVHDDDASRNLGDSGDDASVDGYADSRSSAASGAGDRVGRAAQRRAEPTGKISTELRQYHPLPAATTRQAAVERHLKGTSEEFELPYDLPDTSVRRSRRTSTVALGAARPSSEQRVLYVPANSSAIQQAYVNTPTRLRGSEKSMRGMLARSGRAGWSGAGTVAYASYAELRDGAEGAGPVPEVAGACAIASTPFHWQKPARKPLTQCAVAVLRILLQHTEVAAGEQEEGTACPHACVHLHRTNSHNTLSEEKLSVVQRAVEAVTAASGVTLSRVEALSTRQTATVLSLLSALYALPEADATAPNAMEEARYLRQLRHRNLASWLKRELAAFLDATKSDSLTPAEELMQVMLCHKLREARASAKSIASEELARVVRVCGEGNQFGGYVEMAKGGFKDGEEVRRRVVALLSGKVEAFITDDEYKGVSEGGAVVQPARSAATWKQLLGIFTFYGCVPDTPAEEIIIAFLDRLRAPTSRKLNPLPPYAERVDAETLRTKRGQDLVRRGNTFQDAALLLLEAFANGSVPPSSCLHPHASSYAGTDYLTAFVILTAMRAIELPRPQTYKDAELSVLLGMTAELECNDETWYWGLLPLHLIEVVEDRCDAVRAFCGRNAMRALALRQGGQHTADFNRLTSLLCVQPAWLEPVTAPAEEMRVVTENTPSVTTHAALERALSRLSMDAV